MEEVWYFGPYPPEGAGLALVFIGLYGTKLVRWLQGLKTAVSAERTRRRTLRRLPS